MNNSWTPTLFQTWFHIIYASLDLVIECRWICCTIRL